MTGAEIMAAVGFFLSLAYAMWFAWGRIEGKVKVAEDKADKALESLADYKTQVATTYATKAGMQEQTAQLLRAIEGVGNRIDSMAERLDNIILQRTAGRTRQ